jgi:hypothetical protein
MQAQTSPSPSSLFAPFIRTSPGDEVKEVSWSLTCLHHLCAHTIPHVKAVKELACNTNASKTNGSKTHGKTKRSSARQSAVRQMSLGQMSKTAVRQMSLRQPEANVCKTARPV